MSVRLSGGSKYGTADWLHPLVTGTATGGYQMVPLSLTRFPRFSQPFSTLRVAILVLLLGLRPRYNDADKIC